MNTSEVIRERRSVKHFDPAHQITKEEFDQLIDLASRSPLRQNLSEVSTPI